MTSASAAAMTPVGKPALASRPLASRRRARALVALCRARLFATRAGRIGRFLGVACAVVVGVVAVALRASEGGGASLASLPSEAARLLPWIAGAPLAFAAASDRTTADRADGIEALAAAHGIAPRSVESARTLAAMSAVTWAIGGPLVLITLLAAALAGGASAALHRALAAVGALVFAGVAGIALGALGAISGRVARRRGRWLLVALVVAPWALADLAGHGAWSLPGALSAVIDFTLASADVAHIGVTPIGLA